MSNYPNPNEWGQYQNPAVCPYADEINPYSQNCWHPMVCPVPKPSINRSTMAYTVSVPINLAKSLEGKYFVGYADNLTFGEGTSAFGRLYNPPNSGVNLHVAVWTVTAVGESPFRAQIWFNSTPPGMPQNSNLVTPSNLALYPIPCPRVKLQYATKVEGNPTDGIKAFVRRGLPETTIADDEQGKFIFPPGGSFMIFLSNPESPQSKAEGRVAFGWWEEPICT